MPMVFRSMRKAPDGLPMVARSTSGLGVRVPGMVPPAQTVDIDVDANNDVIFNAKGMSVNDAWRNILPTFCPCGAEALLQTIDFVSEWGKAHLCKQPSLKG